MADETQAGGVGAGGEQPPAAAPPGEGQQFQQQAPGAAPPPVAPVPKKKKKYRVLWVIPIILILMAAGLFAAFLFLYPYTKALRVNVDRRYSSNEVNDTKTVDMYVILKNNNSFDWPKAELVVNIPGRGTYFCQPEGTGAFETQLAADGSMIYKFARLKNMQSGQEEIVSLSQDEFRNAEYEVKVDFAGSDDVWVKLRNKLGMETKCSISRK